MIIVMKPGATREQIEAVSERLVELGFKTHPIYGQEKTVIGAIGDKKALSSEAIINLPGVEKIVPIMKPYKLVSRELKETPSIVRVGGVPVGGRGLVVMAGPCAVESEEQLLSTARAVKAAGAQILRGGAFKPRTSPYAFQGLEEEGIKMLARVREEAGLPFVTEVVDTRDVALVAEYADAIQIGARNMQNFRLLKEAGATGKPILLKRGLAATIEEWLMAAEYILDSGNPNVILCERGIRTFETATRFTLDLAAVAVVKENSHLPVIVDPSHGTGSWRLVLPMARAAVAAGADGLIIEVHPDPARALCDGPQSLHPETFDRLMGELAPVALAVGRGLAPTGLFLEKAASLTVDK
ncbi:MAG: 3-deoxy-7-phosphoheptulonate synthase [Moorella sp. (in: firmicutes)]|uniref:3-deoxy-7-phosphoheptulonate synthase n=1 Tax=unclassified Neomoorella TaxID=2676739 RepID=UPI0010FFAEDB|nr:MULTISPECIES: 3-deoxy-7-phosphoheptulonate synthase [unclassified Moorella (in: firmicutes)]MDK2816650.1 3-deoxy-7-phosphoheptulonate synthase [Moorella sp. (in: firmicutes)]MDK2894511.1 3-deoxy-7-phosphoheptulonate synthase [Moorella sp. (in: firmicutes)]GEA14351.1 3-deoxy-7-phosphoheptulonate synthase [Moorella sp. E308F]GEA18277.1 3-deoxy-7-phosphoheptulonate synthase [Moorella sp. E306M]